MSRLDGFGPLAGVRVLEFSNIGPVLFTGMLLADMGAEILLIEPPSAREAAMPFHPREDPLRRGRSPLAADLKDAAVCERIRAMLPHIDLIIEGYRPGVMERLGLGPEQCLQLNPKLVYGRVTGWGRDGPLSESAGHDPNYAALVGLVHSVASPNGGPHPPLNIADFAGGATYLAMGVLAALAHVRGGGEGQVVDASILDGTASLMSLAFALRGKGMWSDRHGTNLLDGGCPFASSYATADGRYVMVCALEPSFYAEMVSRLGLDLAELPQQQDPAGWPELRSRFAQRFAGETQAHWASLFDGTNACVTPVLTSSEAVAHPHNIARSVFVGPLAMPAAAPRFIGTPTHHAVQQGEETDALLSRWAGQPRD